MSPAILHLPFRPPFDREGVLSYHRRWGLAGLEAVEDDRYRRTVSIGAGEAAIVEVQIAAGHVRLTLPSAPARPGAEMVNRVRRLFDLDADPLEVERHLGRDPLLAPLLERYPGPRLLGCWDPFEAAVRTVIGQQVSVAAAITFADRLLERYGTPIPLPGGGRGRLFPGPAALSHLDHDLGLTNRRTATVRNLAREVASGRLDLGAEPRAVAADLLRLTGIGPWTTQYLALQLGHADAFPAGDLVLRKVAGGGLALSERELRERADVWRPWRGYAAVLLWRGYLDPAGANSGGPLTGASAPAST